MHGSLTPKTETRFEKIQRNAVGFQTEIGRQKHYLGKYFVDFTTRDKRICERI